MMTMVDYLMNDGDRARETVLARLRDCLDARRDALQMASMSDNRLYISGRHKKYQEAIGRAQRLLRAVEGGYYPENPKALENEPACTGMATAADDAGNPVWCPWSCTCHRFLAQMDPGKRLWQYHKPPPGKVPTRPQCYIEAKETERTPDDD